MPPVFKYEIIMAVLKFDSLWAKWKYVWTGINYFIRENQLSMWYARLGLRECVLVRVCARDFHFRAFRNSSVIDFHQIPYRWLSYILRNFDSSLAYVWGNTNTINFGYTNWCLGQYRSLRCITLFLLSLFSAVRYFEHACFDLIAFPQWSTYVHHIAPCPAADSVVIPIAVRWKSSPRNF